MKKEKIIDVIQFIVTALVNKQYAVIAANDNGDRIDAETIASVIEEYGGLVSVPPGYAYDQMDIYIITENKEVSVDFDLWINGERSDLTLQCDISNDNGNISIA